MATVLIPLPDTDFDVTEVSVPWRMLTDEGHELVPKASLRPPEAKGIGCSSPSSPWQPELSAPRCEPAAALSLFCGW
jgi:hypothetical protein